MNRRRPRLANRTCSRWTVGGGGGPLGVRLPDDRGPAARPPVALLLEVLLLAVLLLEVLLLVVPLLDVPPLDAAPPDPPSAERGAGGSLVGAVPVNGCDMSYALRARAPAFLAATGSDWAPWVDSSPEELSR